VYSRHALRWERLGDSPPSGTPVLDNAALAEALTRTTEFTEAEWSAFAVDELRDDHVVQSGDVFFKPAGVGEASLRTALERFGEIVNVDLSESPALVRFSTHEAARAAARGASELNLIAGGIATLYNERSYDGRRGEAGRDDDDGRGSGESRAHPPLPSAPPTLRALSSQIAAFATRRCVFEFSGSGELLVRVNPKMTAALKVLPPKMLELSSTEPVREVELQDSGLETRVEEVTRLIERATFTGRGDKPMVVGLYEEYVGRIAGALQPLLALGTATTAVELPPMPTDPKALRAWHDATLRAQHATIADALSGERLDTLTGCVRVAIEGVDAKGRPLAVRDAATRVAWLAGLGVAAAPRGALLTAGPAAGKTWLTSLLIRNSKLQLSHE
jgi:hypothetical protein